MQIKKMGIRIILITFGLDLHRMLPASQQFAKLSCDGEILPPRSIEFLVDIFLDGHRPTGNLPVARRASPNLLHSDINQTAGSGGHPNM